MQKAFLERVFKIPFEEIKKAAATLRAQGGGSTAQAPYAFKKRKHTLDVKLLGKGASGLSVHLEVCEGAFDPLRHKVGEGLMTS